MCHQVPTIIPRWPAGRNNPAPLHAMSGGPPCPSSSIELGGSQNRAQCYACSYYKVIHHQLPGLGPQRDTELADHCVRNVTFAVSSVVEVAGPFVLHNRWSCHRALPNYRQACLKLCIHLMPCLSSMNGTPLDQSNQPKEWPDPFRRAVWWPSIEFDYANKAECNGLPNYKGMDRSPFQ